MSIVKRTAEAVAMMGDALRVGREDSWVSAILGWGGARDRSASVSYATSFRRLSDAELATMYATEDMSAKICDVYPREALRVAPECAGVDADEDAVNDFLKPYDVDDATLRALIWGNVFGGSAVWLGSYTADPATPLIMGEQIDFLRVIDRRWLNPIDSTRDALGRPLSYQVSLIEGGITRTIHASRLVLFPGALTDDLLKQQLNTWDLSALQRPYNALRSDGSIWKATENLISQASIGVMMIEGLYGMIGANSATIKDRMQMMMLNKGVTRDLVIDKSKEDFKRVESGTFAGLSDLSINSMKRVAGAAEMPVSLFFGEAPKGLNATGEGDLRWFLTRVTCYQAQKVHPRALRIRQVLLAQPGSPARNEWQKLQLKWGELWSMTAKERAEVYSMTASADNTYILAQVVTPEEIGLSRFGTDGYSQETEIDRDLREKEADAPDAEGGIDPATQTAPNAAPIDPATPTTDVQKQAFNGAQVSSMIEIVKAVTNEEIPRDAAVAMLALAFQITEVEASALLGSAGKGFEPKAPKPGPFGAPPPPPAGEPKLDAPPAPEPKPDREA